MRVHDCPVCDGPSPDPGVCLACARTSLRELAELAQARLDALEFLRAQGGVCPCGAWFGDEHTRNHVTGCLIERGLRTEAVESIEG